MDMPRRPAPEIDTAWFLAQIQASNHPTQAEVAARLRARSGRPMDPAAFSRLLRGERGMQIDEAQQLAKLLKVPLAEVLRRAGLPAPEAEVRVPVIGHVDSRGAVLVYTGAAKGDETIAGPSNLPHDAVALAVRAGGELAVFDGAVLFLAPLGPVTPECIGRYCAIGIDRPKAKEPKAVLGYLKRGYAENRYTVLMGPGATGMERREGVVALWAAPVLWIKP
jgi:hypothetical protein